MMSEIRGPAAEAIVERFTELSDLSLCMLKGEDYRSLARQKLRCLNLIASNPYSLKVAPILPKIFQPDTPPTSGALLKDSLTELSLLWRPSRVDLTSSLRALSALGNLKKLSVSSRFSEHLTATNFPKLEELRIYFFRKKRTTVNFMELPNLRRLSFISSYLLSEFWYDLPEVIADIPRLFSSLNLLRLERVYFGKEQFRECAVILNQIPSLRLEVGIARRCFLHNLDKNGDIVVSEGTSSCESHLRSLETEAASLGMTRCKFSFNAAPYWFNDYELAWFDSGRRLPCSCEKQSE